MKWAIIGCGNISNKFSENLVSIKDTEISCIASKDINRLNKFGDKFRVENKNRFSDYKSILSSKFDVAYIGLINSLHKEVILNLTSNQKNIIVEKPSFLTIKDFTECADLIKEKKILFVESMMNLHHPQTSQIFEILNSNELGRILSFNFKFGYDIRKKFLYFFKKKINFVNRLTDPTLGGGAINDLGCYGVAFSNKIASFLNCSKNYEIKKKVLIGPTGVDINSKININYSNNFHSTIHVAFDKNFGNSAEIVGSKGSLYIPSLITPSNNYNLILKTNVSKELKFSGGDLYTYIIQDVERYLGQNIKDADGYGLRLQEIEGYLKILEHWKSEGYEEN